MRFRASRKATRAAEGDGDGNGDSDGDGDGAETWVAAAAFVVLVLASHALCYFLHWAVEHNGGFALPGGWSGPLPGFLESIAPTRESVGAYGALMLSQVAFAACLPGPIVLGLPVGELGGARLAYRCNGLAAWYATLTVAVALHATGVYPLQQLERMAGPLMSTAILAADALAVALHVAAAARGLCSRRLRRVPRDFVMGRLLNPRLLSGRVDVKMLAEVRTSWTLLFLLSCSAALVQRDRLGHVTGPMAVTLLAHGLYANAVVKGEEFIPLTWDIQTERFGWMLAFWNMAGVPFVYTFNARFLAAQPPEYRPHAHWAACPALAALLLAAYVVWDEANAQKCSFRRDQLRLAGGADDEGPSSRRRWAFPHMPRAVLDRPKALATRAGPPLLVDGWYSHVRKPHYTADMAMAWLAAVAAGGASGFVLPYYHPLFLTPVLVHREIRDSRRCREKYGADWDRYCARVPYVFIPGLW